MRTLVARHPRLETAGTGSDRRTGEVIARTLANKGATVIFHGNTAAPQASYAVLGDVASAEGGAEVLRQVAALGLDVDILVNNFGTTDNHSWDDAGTAKWLELYQINVLSSVRMAQGYVRTEQVEEAYRKRAGFINGQNIRIDGGAICYV